MGLGDAISCDKGAARSGKESDAEEISRAAAKICGRRGRCTEDEGVKDYTEEGERRRAGGGEEIDDAEEEGERRRDEGGEERHDADEEGERRLCEEKGKERKKMRRKRDVEEK